MTTSNKRTVNKIGFFYGLTALADTVLWQVISSWQNYYYFPPDGEALISVGWLYGALMFLNAAIGVLIAFPIGYWSDRTHTRWGRRLPFMFLAGVPRLILFVMLWTPPKQTESVQNLFYLTLILISHGIAAGLQQIPGEALLPELAPDDQGRVQISAWASAFGLLGMVLSGFAGVLIERWGYVKTVSLYAGIAFLLFYLPFLVLRERPGSQNTDAHPYTLRQSFMLIVRNKPFLLFSLIKSLGLSSVVLMQAMFPYIVTEVFLLSEGDTMYFFMTGLVATIACYPLMTWLSERMGKERVFAGSQLAAALVLPGVFFIGPWMSIPLIIPGLLWVVLEAVSLSGSAVLTAAFIAEIIDFDAARTGQRREGAYYAALEFVDRIVYSVIAMIPPLLLVLGREKSGLTSALGIRLSGLLCGALAFTAFLLFLRYPLRRKEHQTSQDKGASAIGS